MFKNLLAVGSASYMVVVASMLVVFINGLHSENCIGNLHKQYNF